MAVAPSVSVRERTRAAWESETTLWRAALVAGVSACVLYVVTPYASISRNAVIYPLTELAAIAAIVYGVRRYRPAAPAAWLLLAGGFGLWWVGDVLWGVYVVLDVAPFPSPADFFYLGGYPVMGAGLLVAVARRRDFVDLRASIDAALVTVSGFLLTWIYVVDPVLSDSSLSVREKLVSVAYPIGDVLLLGIAIRFLLGASWNVRSLRLLAIGLGATLLGDALFNLQLAGHVKQLSLSDTILLVGVVCVGLAGLHPTMTSLTEEHGEPPDVDDTARFGLLLAICLLPPTVLTVQSLRGDSLHLPVTIASMAAIAVLAVIRFSTLTNRAIRAADRERLLTVYAGELLRARDRDELYDVAERTANELIDDGSATLFAPPETDGAGTHAFSAPVEVRGEPVAELVADASPLRIRRAHDSLETVASELALSLEREQLLAAERETAAALATQNERLRELDGMKDQFVSTVSHELRTPLTSMVGYLEILLAEEVGELSEDQMRFLEIVDRNSRRLNSLIEDILMTSRLDTGRLSIEPEAVDMGTLVTERVESIHGAADQKGVELRLSVADSVPELWADPMRVGQVVDNLLSNAFKFTPPGGTVAVMVTTDGESIRIDVSDTGVGIPPDEVDRLFDRFFRASTASTVPGTGLGLSIARGIAEAHGGTISVASEVGVGTTFTLELPLESPFAKSEAPA